MLSLLPKNTTSSAAKSSIAGWSNCILKVGLNDGRFFVGRFICVDFSSNLILRDTTEYRKRPAATASEEEPPVVEYDERRIGLVMLPGKMIDSCNIMD